MNKLLSLVLILGICTLAGPAFGEKDSKKICKEAQAQLESLQKQMEELKATKAKLTEEFNEARSRFEKYRSQHSGMKGCSKGNPNNSPECQQVLDGLAQAGADMNRIDAQRDQLGPKKLALENEMFKPQGQLKVHQCK